MKITVEGLVREFRFKDVTLPDPDPGRTPEQVMQFYANQYSELTTASIGAPKHEAGRIVYEFQTTFGTKG